MNIADTVLDPEMSEAFIVKRSKGKFVAGGWQEEPTQIKMWGTVTNARAREIQMLPEGDRVMSAMTFYAPQELFVTNLANQGTSDIIVWRGENWRVLLVNDYSNRGYWKAIAARMSGA